MRATRAVQRGGLVVGFVKSSQVKLLISNKAQINAQCKELSTAKKESTPQAARYVKSCGLKSTGAPPVYGTGWTNFPWAALDADLSKSRGIPTRELLTAPVSSLLSQCRCDIADSRAIETKRCSPRCSLDLPGASPPKRRCPS